MTQRVFHILLFLLFPLYAAVAQYSGESDGVEQMKEDVDKLTSISLEGRAAGTSGEVEASLYLYRRLSEAGVYMIVPESGQDFSIIDGGDTVRSRNIVGIVEGYDPQLRNQYVVIGANLDHIGTNSVMVNGKEQKMIFPGANDNASGLAVLMNVAKKVASSAYMFRRSVVFAAFGAKELGTAGSWYFVNRAFGQIDSVSVMVDLRMIGKYGPNNKFTYYTAAPSLEIYNILEELSESGTQFPPAQGVGMLPSGDYLAFYEKNIPTVMFTTGDDVNNRTVRDVAEELAYDEMEHMSEYIYQFICAASNTDKMLEKFKSEQESATKNKTLDAENVYSPFEVEVRPEFMKGDERTFLSDWVYTYLRYPEDALKYGISGTVVVEFIVEKDGSVTNVKAVKGDDLDLMDEAVRVVAVSPKWKPGQIGGEKVRVKYSIPVEFRLKMKKR